MKIPSRPALLFFLYISLCINFIRCEINCPTGCECDQSKLKVKCSGNSWNDFRVIDSSAFTLLMFENLDLSNNKVTAIAANFLHAPSLKKLNLSENKIRSIDINAFKNVANLTVLDLSNNNLHNLSREIFVPLKFLERLILSSNYLNSLLHNVFEDLSLLRTLDLSENPWHCDCSMILFARWVKTKAIKLKPVAKCLTPESQANVPIKKVELNCMLPGLELVPSLDQVVFAGDSLSLRCRAVGLTDPVQWVWSEQNPKILFPEVEVEERTLHDHGLVESLVRIERLRPDHSGDWVCSQVSGGNHTAALSVVVLSEMTIYCPNEITKDNKGVYFWPRTVINHKVELPCAEERVGSPISFATYFCDLNGQWDALNTSLCPYTSETTKILEQFARDNLTVAKDSIVEKAKHLLNITSNACFSDFMDIVFISRTIQLYSEHTIPTSGLPSLVVDIVSSLLRLPYDLFANAERHEKACTRIRNSLNYLAQVTPTFQEHKSFVAFEGLPVNPKLFNGITCAWRHEDDSRQLQCSTSGRAVRDAAVRDVVAILEMPASLFFGVSSASRQLIVSMFDNGSLFPDLATSDENLYLSSVVGAHVVDSNDLNLTVPITIMMKVKELDVPAEPVRWDDTLNSGSGGWTTDGCQASRSSRNMLLFHCHHLGYYSLRQGLPPKQRPEHSIIGLSAMYSGSFALSICLLAAVSSFYMCHGVIQMSRRAKHAVANTWLSMFLLCSLYSFGIFAVEDVKICEIIGLALHYFSLTTMLWMVVAGNHMYKRLSRGSSERSPDELPPGVPLQKPILGLYLVGWGVGLIVCGISGAVHLRDYAQPTFCFLGAGPALSAVLVPSAILAVVLAVFYFLSLCVIRNNDVNGQLSEGTGQGTENVDIELLEEGALPDRQSMPSDLTDSEDIEDPEHSPLIQLKAHVIALVLFILLWLSGAFAATASVYKVIPHQELVANALYCLFAFTLGAFILYFYCVARSDIRSQWGTWCRLLGKNQRCCRTRNVSDAHASMPLQVATPNPVITNRPPSVNSGLTGQSSSSHRTKAVLELNNCDSSGSGIVMHCKPSNSVNLVAMHRQMYRSNNSMPTYQEISHQNCADVFYNPKQSIVAKKFFKKQRRNRRNELGVRRRGDGGGTSDGEMPQVRRTWRPSAESAVFLSSDMENTSEKMGPNLFQFSGSKINNTNIHVGNSSHKKDPSSSKDPNILSEDEEDKGGKKSLLARLVIGAEEEGPDLNRPMASSSSGLDRVDEESLGPPPDCRSVELQCSLGSCSDGDDAFCQKIDDMQLILDESNEDKISTPPQYVTVLDPKYGVVKVTISDYQEQSDRLSLASSTECDRSLLPGMPEEDEIVSASCSKCSGSKESLSRDSQDLVPLIDTRNDVSSRPVSPPKRMPPKTLNLNARGSHRRKHSHRRSLPSSPESRDVSNAHRRSLPSSPEIHNSSDDRHAVTAAEPSRRGAPTLTLPPPPPLDAGSLPDVARPASPDLNDDADHDQWQRPDAPTSPAADRTRRPLSEDLIEYKQRKQLRACLDNSPETPSEEVKKETSV